MLDDAGPATDARRQRDRDEWARCKSGALGRRKSAVEDLLDALSFKVADEPRARDGRVYIAAAQAGPLLKFARMGIIKCIEEPTRDYGRALGERPWSIGEQAAGRFLLALASVEDVADVHPWAARTTWGWMSASDTTCGVTVPAEDLQALIAAARYWASGHWPGLAAPIEQDLAGRGVCPAPPLAPCVLGCVRVCGASGGVTWTCGWTC